MQVFATVSFTMDDFRLSLLFFFPPFSQQIRSLEDKMKNARTHFNMLFVMVITDVALHDVKVS